MWVIRVSKPTCLTYLACLYKNSLKLRSYTTRESGTCADQSKKVNVEPTKFIEDLRELRIVRFGPLSMIEENTFSVHILSSFDKRGPWKIRFKKSQSEPSKIREMTIKVP